MSISVDLLFLGGKVITGTSSSETFDAVAVKHGRIVAVGRANELGRLEARRKVHLDGQVLIPGLIDAHNHLSMYSVLLRYVDCRVPLNGDVSDLQEIIRLKVQETAPGEWIRGWGFADYKVKQHRFPTLRELDEVSPSNPVVVLHASGHSAVLNTLALEQLGIDEQTPDPPDGQIERDPQTGKPNGVLHEAAMQQFSFESMFREFVTLGPDEQIAVLQVGIEEYVKMGITTVCDAGCLPPLLSAYQEAERRGVLKCRVVAMPFYEWNEALLESGLRSGFGSERFKIGAIKLIGDGSLSGRTAAVSEPYQNTDGLGILYRDQEALDKIVQELDARGYQIAVHAIGDRAVEQVLLAYEKVIGRGNPNIRRHRMEHAGILNPDLLRFMADIDLVIATQPRMLYEQGDGFYRSCGEERIQWVYPYRAFIEKGLHVAGSSDCPVVSPDPILGMRDALLRQTEEGRVLAPAQRLDPEQALHMFTQDAAYSIFEEDNKGTIEEGKLADMIVLSGDPLTTPPETWEEQVQVEMTVVGGEIVYST
ncbi:MAG: amidohydrolase [Chloroflexota bacterium]|nr:amidohydrolase [Chloroflexota bacterium]